MKLILIFTSLLLGGCATSHLWSHQPSYEETVIGFYLVQDKYEVVAVGKKYNYLFKVKPEMYEAFKISHKYDFSLSFENFRSMFDNRISGRFTLSIDKTELSESELKNFRDLGFMGVLNPIGLKRFISGTRYQASGIMPMTQFYDGYKVSIKEPNAGLLYAGKATITPLTLAVDTLILIPIALAVIVFDLDISGTQN